MSLPYDPSRVSLLFPAQGETVLQAGAPPSEEKLCVEAARLAYKQEADLAKIFRSIGFNRFEFFDVGDTEAFLAGSSNLTVLAFRGTEQKVGDIATDLDAKQVAWTPGGRVHAGFAHALSIAQPTIKEWLAGTTTRVVFTGHSLGAALATLAASLHRPGALYTIGSPRVGNADFVNTLSSVSISRYVGCCDLVTRLPPEALLLESFAHAGPMLYIDSAGIVHKTLDQESIRRDQAQAREKYILDFSWRRGTVPVRDLADHTPINYVSAIWGIRA